MREEYKPRELYEIFSEMGFKGSCITTTDNIRMLTKEEVDKYLKGSRNKELE